MNTGHHRSFMKRLGVGSCMLALLAVWQIPVQAEPAVQADEPDYVSRVDPCIMSARGCWFFLGTGKRPFGMVNVFPDTRNEGQVGGGYNYRLIWGQVFLWEEAAGDWRVLRNDSQVFETRDGYRKFKASWAAHHNVQLENTFQG
jgi:hypothetical protein